MGIDPGTRVTGWGVVEGRAAHLTRLAMGVVATPRSDLARRLGAILSDIEALIEHWQPESIALECAFVGRNAASALRIGEVRGAVLAAAGRSGLEVFDYSPASVKSAVTGSGAAEKVAVARCVTHLLGTAKLDAGDATDALAVAICHLRHASFARRLAGAPGRASGALR